VADRLALPRWVTPVSAAEVRRGDGADVAAFIEMVCTVTQDTVSGPAGSPMVLRAWQKRLLGEVFARRPDGRLRHRVALIGMPRKNGKSALAAGLALDGLLSTVGGEVYSCAADRDQARIVFRHAQRMVANSPDLSERCKVFRDLIEVPATGSVYRSLSSESFTKEGLSPTRVIFDEVHAQPNRELWDVMALALGARVDPLMIGITTAGVRQDSTGQDSVCYQLFQHGLRIASGEVTDPSFHMAWWGAAAEADHRDPKVWSRANPALGDLLDPEDLASAIVRTPENEYRTKRLNQWVAAQQAWLPAGAWDACREQRSVPDGVDVVLAFDGSFSGDSTGLTVHEIGTNHVDVVGLWERPPDLIDWQVDQDEVEATVRAAFETWNVQLLAYDPRVWQQLFQRLAAEGYPCEPVPQGQTMIAAAQRFYEDVINQRLTHSGDPALARHVGNAVVKASPQGPRVQKESKGSPRKIDLAIAAVMGHVYASQLGVNEYAEPYVGVI
jgi:phage terminase large subunit-like protein